MSRDYQCYWFKKKKEKQKSGTEKLTESHDGARKCVSQGNEQNTEIRREWGMTREKERPQPQAVCEL